MGPRSLPGARTSRDHALGERDAPVLSLQEHDLFLSFSPFLFPLFLFFPIVRSYPSVVLSFIPFLVFISFPLSSFSYSSFSWFLLYCRLFILSSIPHFFFSFSCSFSSSLFTPLSLPLYLRPSPLLKFPLEL